MTDDLSVYICMASLITIDAINSYFSGHGFVKAAYLTVACLGRFYFQ